LNRLVPLAAWAIFLCSCSPSPPPPETATPKITLPGTPAPTVEALDSPRIPVGADRRVIQTLVANLDQDPAEEQILVLQDKTNLSLPVTIQVAHYDQARKTYYLAWEGKALASASQPLTLGLEDLIGDHQQEILVQGLDEGGQGLDEGGPPTLDVLRLLPQTGSLGLAYRSIFSKVSKGTIQINHPVRPDSYGQGQNSDLSDPIVVDEADPASKAALATLRTTYSWLFQKGEYVATGVEHYQRNVLGDAALEKVFSADNAAIEAFLQGPWVKVVPDKAGLLILFFDPTAREITFATSGTQEVYGWEVSSRSTRSSLYIAGSNDLISLIKLQMSVAITASDTLEVNAQDNPAWTGTYKKLDPSAARVLAREGTGSLVQDKPPTGLFKNDKGDEFDFQVPEIRLKLSGVAMTGSVALFPLGDVKVLQIRVPPRPGNPGLSRAYALVAKEESSTSRVVRTLRLQGGVLTSKGWVSDQSDPLRLEQVEGTANNAVR